MNTKKLKILLAKPGLDGHDVGVKVLAHALIDKGFDVVYTGLRKTIEEIVALAVQNEADLIGLSILSGTHRELCQEMNGAMKKRSKPIPWIVGGNIPDEDVNTLEETGALKAFPTGTTIEQVLAFCDQLAAGKGGSQ